MAQLVYNGTSCTSKLSYDDMRIEAPPGSAIGGVKAEYSKLKFSIQGFSITNGDGETILKIVKSAGQFFSPEVDFKVVL